MDNQYETSKKDQCECAGIDMISGYFGQITHFNLSIAGKCTSLSRCEGCRPCESKSTEIENLNLGCSVSKIFQT